MKRASPIRVCRAGGEAFVHLGDGRPPVNCDRCTPEAHARRNFITRSIRYQRSKGAFVGELRA